MKLYIWSFVILHCEIVVQIRLNPNKRENEFSIEKNVKRLAYTDIYNKLRSSLLINKERKSLLLLYMYV